ncbi:TPA: hypothetical protein ACX6SN_003927 [Photobacterium damselae]
MPVIINGIELPIMPAAGYSSTAIAREYRELASITLENEANELVRFILSNDKSHAAVVRAQPDDNDRHQILTKLEFYSSNEETFKVTRFWENQNYRQVSLVATDKRARNSALATFLYIYCVVVGDMVIFSDNEQTMGGKALWKNIAKIGQELLSVYVFDASQDTFMLCEKGDRLVYTGDNIDDDKVWSCEPDRTKETIILKMRKK